MRVPWVLIAAVVTSSWPVGGALGDDYCGGHATEVSVFGIDAIQGTIEVVPTKQVAEFDVWIGIDYNSAFWVQTGWLRYPQNPVPRAYLEYKTDSGYHPPEAVIGNAVSGAYAIFRSGDRLFITIYGLVYANLPWSDFNRYPMCHVQVGASTWRTDQHVPGEPGNSCEISNVGIHHQGYLEYTTPTLYALTTWSCGDVSIAGGSVWIWDRRSLNQDVCPP